MLFYFLSFAFQFFIVSSHVLHSSLQSLVLSIRRISSIVFLKRTVLFSSSHVTSPCHVPLCLLIIFIKNESLSMLNLLLRYCDSYLMCISTLCSICFIFIGACPYCYLVFSYIKKTSEVYTEFVSSLNQF